MHSAGIIEWTKEDVKKWIKKKKIITMYGGLYPRSNIEQLYLPRCEGGSGGCKYRKLCQWWKEKLKLLKVLKNLSSLQRQN